MDYAGALGWTMIFVLIMGVLFDLIGLLVFDNAEKSKKERAGLVLSIVGAVLILASLAGWVTAIWLGYAQAAGTVG